MEKQDNHFPRLQFLKNFIATNNISYGECGKILGVTRANISHLINSADDMRMSQIEKIIESQGYSLTVNLTRENCELEDPAFEISDLVPDENHKLVLPPLYYILIAMRRYGITRQEIADRMGVIVSSVRYWLCVKQDISLSRLLELAKSLDLNVTFKIAPKQKLDLSNNTGHRLFVVQTYLQNSFKNI